MKHYYYNLLTVSVWEALSIQKFELLNKKHQIKQRIQEKEMERNAVTHSAKFNDEDWQQEFQPSGKRHQPEVTEQKKDLDIIFIHRMNVCHCTKQPPTKQKTPTTSTKTMDVSSEMEKKTFPVHKQTTMARDIIWYPVVLLDIFFQERWIKIVNGSCQVMLLGEQKVCFLIWNCKTLTYVILGSNGI